MAIRNPAKVLADIRDSERMAYQRDRDANGELAISEDRRALVERLRELATKRKRLNPASYKAEGILWAADHLESEIHGAAASKGTNDD